MTIQEQKEQLRRQMKDSLLQTSADERTGWSKEICQYLDQSINPSVKVIAGFAPLQFEPNIVPFLQQQQRLKKTIVLPHWQKGEKQLHFYEVRDWGELKTGKFGILEPSLEKEIDQKQINSILIPGLAFDSAGQRLGRGEGFYDRFLTQLLPNVQIVGVCFKLQVIGAVPTEKHDMTVQKVIANV